jgi:C-terminal processing protease CtpA/Prc
LGSFAWPDPQQFRDFMHDAFAKLHAARTRTLIIDLRDNGGGDDAMWIEGVMPYLATRRYRTASHYRKRVVVADPAKREAVGDVVEGEINTWYSAQPSNPLHFTGNLYVIVGAGTFSSAVSFTHVIQDFDFGIVAGVRGSVRSEQSGGARRTTLTNTGLVFVSPRFVLTRPSGAPEPRFLTPDIEFEDSEARFEGWRVRPNERTRRQ